jgi:CHC2 zinc finger/Toprim-like
VIDFQTIRATVPLADFCRGLGMELHRNGLEGEYKCLCPFHTEKTPSFVIYPDNHFYCFGCGGHGDVTDMAANLEGMGIGEAAKKLSGESDFRPVILPAPAKPKELHQLTNCDIKRMATAAHRLADNLGIMTQLAAWRPEWTLSAISRAALDGDLGYEDNCEYKGVSGPALLYGYTHGIKARWLAPDRDGNRVFRWLGGGAQGQCWRQSLLGNWHRTVYITEGETDALSLLSFDIEEDGESLVLALAGAEMLPKPKAFSGLHIVIVPDPDQAGERAENKLRAMLEPLAQSIVTLQMEGLISGK